MPIFFQGGCMCQFLHSLGVSLCYFLMAIRLCSGVLYWQIEGFLQPLWHWALFVDCY